MMGYNTNMINLGVSENGIPQMAISIYLQIYRESWLVVYLPHFSILLAVPVWHSVLSMQRRTPAVGSAMIVTLDFGMIHEKLLCIRCELGRQVSLDMAVHEICREGMQLLAQN